MANDPLTCWSCDGEVEPGLLDWEAHLVPRAARHGGPVLIYRCRNCGLDNVVERNPAGEHLLIPPGLAGVRNSNVRGGDLARARKWERDHTIRRAGFLSRSAPAATAIPAPETTAPPSIPPAPEPEPEPAAADSPPRPRRRELNRVLTAYEILGLELTATPDEIRRRYRELSKKCHPDRVADLDEEIRKTAERRYREIREAYDRLAGD